MMHILQKFLAAFARAILRKYKPKIVGVTGSVGKSSAKEAILAVLRERFHTRASLKSYNNQLGVPLAIIGKKSGGRSLIKWLGVFSRAMRLLVRRMPYPDVLVLEMGADRPGDLAYLLSVAPPDIGVVTAVAPVHTEFFRDLEGVRREKGTLVCRLPHTGTAVLAHDDELVRTMAADTRARVMTYGFREEADVRAVEYALHFRSGEDMRHAGTFFTIAHGGATAPVALIGVLGRQHVYAALAGAAVGVAFGMEVAEISLGLRAYEPPRGRMNIIPGVKGTVLIDDTYNASPRATLEAIDTLRQLTVHEGERRIVVIGDMKELGAYTEEGHHSVGKRAAEIGVDLLVTVGELARDIARGARAAGMPEDRVFEFSEREEAGKFVQDRLKKGDVVLIKGSQSMRLEHITKELMAEPLRAAELLVRQDREWLV